MNKELPPGLRNGYSRISNEILESLMYADLTKREYKICLCILRYGYGYKKEKSEIICHQRTIAKLTGLNEVVIKNSLNLLENKNIIKCNKLNKTLSFNRHIDTWKLNKTLSLEEQKLNKTLSKNLIKREVGTKQNVKSEARKVAPIKKQRAPKERGKERGKEIKKESSLPTTKVLYKDKHLILAKLLEKLIKQNKSDRILGNGYCERWANDIRLTEEVDKRSMDRIREVIEFSQRDSFWKQNILSGNKLRKQFDKLEMQYKEEKSGNQNRQHYRTNKSRKEDKYKDLYEV